MKVFTTVIFFGAFFISIGMPATITPSDELRMSSTPRPPPGPHEEFWDCGTWCYNTCDDPYAEDDGCIRMCRRGYFCEDGYIRKSQNGPCILSSDCPQRASRRRQH